MKKPSRILRGISALAIVAIIFSDSKADDTVPIQFKDGDVISAGVMNAILSRIDDATGVLQPDDLIGTWNLTQIVPYNGQPGNGGCRQSNSCNISGTTDAPDGMSRSRSDVVTFSKSGSRYSYNQTGFSTFVNGHTNTPDSGTVSVVAEAAVFKNNAGDFNYFYAVKKSEYKIIMKVIEPGSQSFNFVILDRQNTSPAPVDLLTATVTGTTVGLTWVDQSNNETGFRVERKTSASGTWASIATPASGATSYSDTGRTSGTYFYRVFSVNTNGDSISSSEVQAVVQ